MSRVLTCMLLVFACMGCHPSSAQQPEITSAMKPFVLDDARVHVLVNARVIDGTGSKPIERQTLVLKDGVIAALGDSGTVDIPPDAKVIDLTGKTVLPGLVQLHEHLWSYAGNPFSAPVSYPRLYLAGGVTSIRTAGAYNPYADLKAKRDIEAGRAVGPWMALTIYAGALATPPLSTREEVKRYLKFWFDSGFTSVKVYAYANPQKTRWVVDYAHSRGMAVLGHLCNTGYVQAAKIGIDSIEHGFVFLPDVVPSIVAGEATGRACPKAAMKSMEYVDANGPKVKRIIRQLVASSVVIDSTLPALESITKQGAPTDGYALLPDFVREYNKNFRARIVRGDINIGFKRRYMAKSAQIVHEFVDAGGLLVAGTDSAVPSGGVVPGYSAARQLELMVKYGFSPLQAIKISTLNGAMVLHREDRVGSVEVGKQADLMVVKGNPAQNISDIRNVEIVFKQGVAYDPQALRESVRGRAGIY